MGAHGCRITGSDNQNDKGNDHENNNTRDDYIGDKTSESLESSIRIMKLPYRWMMYLGDFWMWGCGGSRIFFAEVILGKMMIGTKTMAATSADEWQFTRDFSALVTLFSDHGEQPYTS